MMKHLRLFLAIIGFVYLGTGAELATAQGNGNGNDKGNGVIQSTQEISGIVFNPCCDEYIRLSGSYHYTFNPKTGKRHSNFQGMTGEGVQWDPVAGEWVPTGSSYHGNRVSNSSSSYDEETDSYSGETHYKYRYTNSDGCGYTVHYLATWTWTPEDGYQVDVKIDKITCDNGADVS